jgi:hypothetical protein
MKPYWTFGGSRRSAVSLDEFLAQKKAAGAEFFEGKEPWLKGVEKLSWQNFFRVCTEEMDDLSLEATKLVIEYCLEILEEAEAKIQGNPTLTRLEKALNLEYTEQYENPAYQYQWAMRHALVKEAVNRALSNRFPSGGR